MVRFEQLRYLLTDAESLEQYRRVSYPTIDDIKRRLFLKVREYDRWIPDSLYLLAKEETFKNIETLSDLLTKGVQSLAGEFLDWDKKFISVKPTQQTKWQELITYINPLLLQSALLYPIVHINKDDPASVFASFKEVILPNTKYTALPSSNIIQIQKYIETEAGLHDLHMHLNGALETDQVWQDFLLSPTDIYRDLSAAFIIPKVKEQLEQESQLLEPNSFISLLIVAQKLRRIFYDFLYPEEQDVYASKEILLQKLLDGHSQPDGSFKHPFINLVTKENGFEYLMSVEMLMNILMMKELEENENETVAGLFHFYLLILGLTNRLLVQQTHQNGFDQFQKHTLNGLREQSERIYRRRYFQMHGNRSRHLKFLEGRFSPKKSEGELVAFIDGITAGWANMCEHLSLLKQSDPAVFDHPELRLIAHFIKRREGVKDPFIRHKQLREETFEKARVLGLLVQSYEKYRKLIVGVDAAASEFDAPPEVFAASFRKMRKSSMKHFTYHAGEDFYHIPGGLRAVYEAIIFCGLRNGDRIGHCTATGLPAKQWAAVVGNQILIRKGEYMDDLIFVYHMIITYRITGLNAVIPALIDKIQALSQEIYQEHYLINILEPAWLMRKYCPIHLLADRKDDVDQLRIFSQDEWDLPIAEKLAGSREDLKAMTELKVVEKFHSVTYRTEYDKIIQVDPFEMLSAEQISELQLGLLKEMNIREIVIETLPTSNVRIGFHKDFSTYHIKNWVEWDNKGYPLPPIVVGTDDTGIFATNIYNEYANIYCMLVYDCQKSHLEAMDVLRKIGQNSSIYKFD